MAERSDSAEPITERLLRGMPPPPPSSDSKDGRGRVLVLGGCRELPGAIRLAAEAAMRVGAGKLQIAVCRDLAVPLGLLVPEAMVVGLQQTEAGGISRTNADEVVKRAERCDAVLLGPGMSEDADTTAIVAAVLRASSTISLVLDAGALCVLSDEPGLTKRLATPAVITPHAGEMAGLLGRERETIEADPLAAAREATERFGTLTVMKGGATYIVAPNGDAWCYEGGHVGLATSGSGDTLAGLIVGLLARGADPARAAVWGVYCHGEAGRRLARRHGGIGFLAREIPTEIPSILAEILV
ncbi:NAD(P)H-hydrate dehydratase [Methylorubrum rhodinum]